MKELPEDYYTEDAEAVWEFLQAHPHLLSVLVEGRAVVARHFPGSQVVLMVDRRNEPDGQLVAYIRTDLETDAALERLNAFDNEWWLRQSFGVKCDLLFNLSARASERGQR